MAVPSGSCDYASWNDGRQSFSDFRGAGRGQEGGDLRNVLIGSRSGKGRYACRVFHEAVQRVTAGGGVFVRG